MIPDIEQLIGDPGTLFQAMEPKYEIFYPLPSPEAFEDVDSAVWLAISDYFINQPIQYDLRPNGAIYYLPYRTWIVQLAVYRLARIKACLRLRNCIPIGNVDGMYRDYARRPQPGADYEVGISALMKHIHDQITHHIHYRCNIGIDTAPPPPPASDLYGLFQWQSLYHPTMNDHDLADLVGLTHQAIRNARCKYRQVNREVHQLESLPLSSKKTDHVKTKRGRPKKR